MRSRPCFVQKKKLCIGLELCVCIEIPDSTKKKKRDGKVPERGVERRRMIKGERTPGGLFLGVFKLIL